MNHTEMLKFVKKTLEDGNAIRSSNPCFGFRNRYEHTKRVYNWCMRIMDDFPDCDREMVLVSAIFHDVGYAKNKENHAHESAKLFIEYAELHNLDYEFTMRTAYLISLHSNKELLQEGNIPDELIILLEADLLDEEGAMGIAWDLMGEGAKNPTSFEQGLQSLWSHSGHILHQEYMVSPLAKKYWKEKQDFVREFIKNLSSDLFIG